MLTKGEHLTEDMCYNAWFNILRNPLSCAKELEVLGILIKEHFNPQPYKFEDLQIGMWVYDDKEKLCNLIYETRINCAGEQEIEFQFTMINLDGDEFLCDIFEEGRFFPITKALEYHK